MVHKMGHVLEFYVSVLLHQVNVHFLYIRQTFCHSKLVPQTFTIAIHYILEASRKLSAEARHVILPLAPQSLVDC